MRRRIQPPVQAGVSGAAIAGRSDVDIAVGELLLQPLLRVGGVWYAARGRRRGAGRSQSLSGFQCTQLSVLWTKWGMLGECWESAGRVRGTRGEHAGNIRGNAQGTCAEQAESCVADPWNAKGTIQEHSRKQHTLGTQEHRSILGVDGHDGSCPAGKVRGTFAEFQTHQCTCCPGD